MPSMKYMRRSKSKPCIQDGNQSSNNSESLFNARPASAVAMDRAIMTTRKAAWLLVKTILVHSKKGKLELAGNRRWKQYWVALKGVELLFYNADEKTVTTYDLDEPVFDLDVDGCIVQAVPEHTRLENVFSISSRNGNAYYLQANSQTEVDNWIHCIHTAAATALACRNGQDDIVMMLKHEIQTITENLLTDEKLKKMAVLQLKVEREAQTRQTMNEQIISWSDTLELHHAEYFRLRCYLAAMEGISNPNPQELLSRISRSTKHILSKIGIFSVNSFHCYVNTRNARSTLPLTLEEKTRARTKPKSPGLKKLINSLKVNVDNPDYRNNRISTKNKSCRIDNNDSNSLVSKRDKKPELKTAKHLLHVELPESRSSYIPYESNLKLSDLMERICIKEGLNSKDYFIMLMTEDDNHHGLLDYTIPEAKALLDTFNYSSIRLCPMCILDVTLSNPADYEHGPFGIDVKEISEHRVIVSHVDEGSQARKHGVCVDDEIFEINGQTLDTKNKNNFRDILELFNTSSSISIKLKSMRIDNPKETQQTTENIINFLVCPPPPKSIQPDISDDIINSLIVPAPTEFHESGNVTLLESFEKSKVEIKADDIDEFLQKTEEVNMMTREMNADVLDTGSSAPTKYGVKLQRAILELVDTEKTYVKNLEILLKRYLIPLKEEDFLSKDEADLLVANVREIYEFQVIFFERIKAIIRSESRFDALNEPNEFQNVLYLIGELFLEYVDKFKLYSTFCSCHSRAVKLLELNTNKTLKAFLLARNPKQQHTATLESYLITPIQRILRYPLFMKTMMKTMQVDSEEYNCMKNALVSVERVADYINEMQRISETYTPIFQEMCVNCIGVEKSDVSVDYLLHYGRVQWINHTSEHNGKNGTSNNNNPENLTVFIFRKVIILISDDPNIRKRMSLSSFTSVRVRSEDIKFHSMIPVTHLTLRDHAWSENEMDQLWEIVDTTSGESEKKIVYKFGNRTAEEKKVFVNAIKESMKLNKSFNSHIESIPPSQSKTKKVTNSSPHNGLLTSNQGDLRTKANTIRSKSASPRPLSLFSSRLMKTT